MKTIKLLLMRKTKLCIALLLSISTIVNAQNSINLSKGQQTHLFTNSLTNIKQNAMDQELEINSDVSVNIDVEVKSTSPDFLLTHTIKRIQLKTEGMGQAMVFDSDKKDDRENQIGKILSVILDKPVDLHISSEGKAIEDKQIEASFDVVKNFVGNLNVINAEILIAVPNKIKPGDHWVVEQNKDTSNKSTFDYTVQSITNGFAIINFNGYINDKQRKVMQGVEVKFTSSATVSGTMTVNALTGLIIEKKSSVSSKGETEIMGQNITFSSSSITVSSTK